MGLMSKYVIEVYALSGVVVRANDFRKDLRLVGYSYYSRIEFNVVVGIKGDSMDRYLVRMNESLESVKTLNKCIRTLTTWYLSYTEVYGHVLTNMESMIHYFKLVTEGYTFIDLQHNVDRFIFILCGKVYVDYRIKRHTPLPVLYISPPPTLLNFYHYRDSSR